jgi:O-antigen/teichoic acid export membrane protein
VGAYGAIQLLRVVSSVVLAKLLAPQLFGVMFIVYSLRTGIELISDLGIGQNIVHSRNAEDPEFYNTAWSLQILRGLLLWLIFIIATAPLAQFYQSPILVRVLPVAALATVFLGFNSISLFIIRRRLQIAKFNLFEMLVTIISTITQMILAYLSPTIWALVLGNLIGSALTTLGSYFILPELHHRFRISKKYVWEILMFGKWIYLSSIIYFLSVNFDRLYLAKVIPLELLGVYAIARNISELLAALAQRLGGLVVFPFISTHSRTPRTVLRQQLYSIRLHSLLITAFGLSLLASIADLMIKMLYDQRYHEAAWMLPVLIMGGWFSILCSLNEATLLGFGNATYGAVGNGLKFGFLLLGLPFAVMIYGVSGGVIVVAVSDSFRYLPILVGQIRERFSFGVQDLLMTLGVLGLIALWEYLRWALGYGTSFESLPNI